jgi:hypothetical protein
MKPLLSSHTRYSDPAQEPLHKLWQAVLLGALKDLKGDAPSAPNCQRYQLDAQQWFESPRTGIGSLNWVCEIADLDAGTVRRYALSAPVAVPSVPLFRYPATHRSPRRR